MMASLTIEVDEQVAAAFEAVELPQGAFGADSTALMDALRWSLERVADELKGIAECEWNGTSARAVRELHGRLDALVRLAEQMEAGVA